MQKLREIKRLNKFITNKVTDMCIKFNECNLLEFLDLSNFDTSNVTIIDSMFNECHKLKEIKGLNKFVTNKVKVLSTIFCKCHELEYLDLSNFDTSNIIKMSYMFSGCNKLKIIKGLNEFTTIKVTSMAGLLQNWNELEYLDLSIFDTSNTTYMSCMFNECTKLKEIKGIKGIKGINNFVTKQVTNFSGMFQNCCELEKLNVSNFDTPNAIDLSFMFNECKKLKEIKGINKFVTKKVIDIMSMFRLCNEIENLDLSNFDTSNVIDMSWMF